MKTLTCFLSGDNRIGDGAGYVVLCCVFGDKDPNGAQIKADKETGQTGKMHMGKTYLYLHVVYTKYSKGQMKHWLWESISRTHTTEPIPNC